MWSILRAIAPYRLLATALVAVALFQSPYARAEIPEGIWIIPGKVAIRVFDCSGLLCGQVVWLRDPTLRTPTMCKRTIIWGLQPDGVNRWSNGWFFDPENGRTFNLSAQLVAADTIEAQIYLGVSLFGRTEILHRASLEDLAGPCRAGVISSAD